MLINEQIQRQVLPVLARATVVPETGVQQRAGAQLQLNPGSQVKAEIIASLPNSMYLARIAGEMFKLEIPLNVQPGETLELTFVSADPRVTFQIARPESGGESVSLSSMGKWLSGVAGDPAALPPAGGTLLESPAQGSLLLADRLRASLSQSGLFYESHLAQWAAGGMQLAELFKEPQGRLSKAAGGKVPVDEAGESEETQDAGYADPRTRGLVKEQLLLLNSGVLSWRGEAWPGQGMELAVGTHGAGMGSEIEATLSLALARLGGVRVELRYGPEGLSLEFVCDRPGSAELLKEGGGELRGALAAAGLPLTRMVAKDGETC